MIDTVCAESSILYTFVYFYLLQEWNIYDFIIHQGMVSEKMPIPGLQPDVKMIDLFKQVQYRP